MKTSIDKQLIENKKEIAELRKQNKALYVAIGKLERAITTVDKRARRVEGTTRTINTTISALKRKLGIRE